MENNKYNNKNASLFHVWSCIYLKPGLGLILFAQTPNKSAAKNFYTWLQIINKTAKM